MGLQVVCFVGRRRAMTFLIKLVCLIKLQKREAPSLNQLQLLYKINQWIYCSLLIQKRDEIGDVNK